MPGVILVPNAFSIGLSLSELLTAVGAGKPDDFIDRVTFIPLP